MKFAAYSFEIAASRANVVDRAVDLSRPRESSRDYAGTEQVVSNPQTRPTSSAVRIVGILAFGQSLIFLVIWLLVCANAGAATGPKAEFTPELKVSSYEPAKVRDPFARPGATAQDGKVAPSVAFAFQLQGILYQSTSPSAIINDKLVTLNKIVTLSAENAEVQVKAVEITRDGVVLEVGGQKVELRLSPHTSQAHTPQ
jgi:hypothetical protein